MRLFNEPLSPHYQNKITYALVELTHDKKQNDFDTYLAFKEKKSFFFFGIFSHK